MRTSGDAEAGAPSVQAAIRQTEPRLTIGIVETLDSRVARTMGPERMLTVLIAVFGLVALGLACLWQIMRGAVARAEFPRSADQPATSRDRIPPALDAPGIGMPSISRRQFLQTTAAVGVAAPFVGCSRQRRPNVVFVLSDDLRWDCHGRGRPSVPQDAEHRSRRQRRRPLPQRVLHQLAVLAQPRQLPERPLRAQPSGDQQLHRVPGQHPQLSAAAARRRLQDRLHRQVAHGRGERREAARLRLLGQPQGPGAVLRHAVQRRRQPAGRSRATTRTSSPIWRSTG